VTSTPLSTAETIPTIVDVLPICVTDLTKTENVREKDDNNKRHSYGGDQTKISPVPGGP
jgi:hypothetical protein